MLTPKQEKFVQNIVKGMSQRQAYKDAYNAKYSDKAIDEKASTLFNSEKVQERYKQIIEKLQEESIMTAKERMKWLTDVINGVEKETGVEFDDGEVHEYERPANLNTKLKAIDILNKMSGEYTTKLEGDIKVNKLEDLL